MSGKIAYLGPAGTFTHQAARALAAPGEEPIPVATPLEVLGMLERGEASSGVVALENSVEGVITGNLDLLLENAETALVAGETRIQVSFSLYRIPGDTTPLTAIASHPAALTQCASFIRDLGAEPVAVASTVAGCELIDRDRTPGWGALGPTAADGLYDLELVQSAVEDNAGAETRFVALRRQCPARSGRDRTAFSCRPRSNEPGSLVRVLEEFRARRINLSMVTSRPTRDGIGEYVFYVECEGHLQHTRVKEVFVALIEQGIDATFHGSFPDAEERQPVSSWYLAAQKYGEALARVAS